MSTESNEKSDSLDNSENDSRSSDWYNERAERNRQRALLLKKSKLIAHPHVEG